MTKEYAIKLRDNYIYEQGFRKKGWLDRQLRLGRMGHSMHETLTHIIPALEGIYPGQYDIQFQLNINWRTVKNPYSLVEYSEQWYDYLLYSTSMRRDASGDRIPLTEEEYDVWLNRNPRSHRSVLNDLYQQLSLTEYNVPRSFRFDSFRVLIHYPEVTIRNSIGHSITIRDLFMRFNFDGSGILNDELQGAKTTFTTDEFEYGYIHSHLPTHSMYGYDTLEARKTRTPFQKVCLGAGEMKMLINNYKDEPTQIEFETILYMLKTVVAWESIEGGPHARMENVTSKTIGAPMLHWGTCDDVFKYMLDNSQTRLKTDLDWYYANGQYNIVDNEKLEDMCASIYRNGNIPYDYMVHKDETGQYYQPNRVTPDDMEPRERDFIPFQGKKVVLKVEGELRLSGERKKYINPNIKNYVKQRLELTCNKLQTKADSITRLHKANNNQGVSRQSAILM